MPTSDLTCSSVAQHDIIASHNGQSTPYESIVVIAGAARSGTSWLGQILDSSPEVAYRFQPFFSHAFRGFVEFDSPRERWLEFFHQLYASTDEFLLQTDKRVSGDYPWFNKSPKPSHLALKTCRFQYLLNPLLRMIKCANLVAVVRHPGGALASWLANPKEFPPGNDVRKEWRFGGCKNQGQESEFFGYYKWKELAHMYLDLHDQFPNRVQVVRYESLVDAPTLEGKRIFEFAGLTFTEATETFLKSCHSQHQESAYSVYKDRSVRDRWRQSLPAYIQEAIHADLQGTRLERFLQ